MALRNLLIAPRAADFDADAAAPRAADGDAEASLASSLARIRFGRRRVPAPRAAAASIAVLAPAREVRALGAAVGLVALRRHPAALVCVHAPGDAAPGASLRAPARTAAARLAASLRARGLDADPRGRVVLVEAGDDDPATAASRALSAAGPLPTVLAVAARDPDLDVLLGAQDAILVALPPSTDPALAALAAASACQLAPSAASIPLAFDPLSRTLALSGLRAPAALRAAVEALVA